MTPTISICIAAYNAELYILECLLSIFQFESSLEKEIIIVDDCSHDSTSKIILAIIEKYKDQNIRFIQNTENLGPAGAYNVATSNAIGKYITFIDSDDFLIASGLSKKIELLENNVELQLVYWNGVFFEQWIYWLDIQWHMKRLFHGSLQDIQKRLYMTIPMLSVSCSVIRRDFFVSIWGFDTACQSNDWVLNIRIFQHLKSKESFTYLLDPVFAYRIHIGNISKDPKRMVELLSWVIEHYLPQEYKNRGYANLYFHIALNAIVAHRYRNSLQLFQASQAFEYQFSRIIIYFLALISPVSFIARYFPKCFSFLKKIIQRIS